ncbi:MAG: hypothetical protein ACU83O_13610 [Gammaproteobacteria bacterium]
MRIEQIHLFFYGALLFACVWGITLAISSAQVKLHLRAIFLTLSLGFIVVPGHGEFIIAPILAAFTPPLRSHLIILGCVLFLIWWAVALGLLKRLSDEHG